MRLDYVRFRFATSLYYFCSDGSATALYEMQEVA